VDDLPGSIPELTPEWLTEVLRASVSIGAGRVTSVEATMVGDGAGLMSQVAQLRVSYDTFAPGAPATLIAKLPPLDETVRGHGVRLGFFECEAQFYQQLAERSQIPTPRCFFTRYDPANGAFLTLLEDLSGARRGDITVGCSLDEGMAAMRALAALHAAWWNSESLAHLPWLQTRRTRLELALEMIDEAWPTFVSRFAEGLGRDQLQALAGLRPLVSRSLDALSGGSLTLLHGDYKLDNMFFRDDDSVTVFDWGLVSAGPAMFDVAYFLGLNLEPGVRRRHEAQLLRAYQDGIAAHGVALFDNESAFAEYRLQLLSVLPQLVCAGGLAEFADHQALERYARGLQRMLAAVSDHQSWDLLPAPPG